MDAIGKRGLWFVVLDHPDCIGRWMEIEVQGSVGKPTAGMMWLATQHLSSSDEETMELG
jgi:hypothetical protein